MKKWTAAALAALTALTLTGCSFQDVMLYLYGGDSFVTSAEPDYTTCDGDNGVPSSMTRTNGSSPSWRRTTRCR